MFNLTLQLNKSNLRARINDTPSIVIAIAFIVMILLSSSTSINAKIAFHHFSSLHRRLLFTSTPSLLYKYEAKQQQCINIGRSCAELQYNKQVPLYLHSSAFSKTNDCDTNTSYQAKAFATTIPYFPIYYNDVYSVNLPPNHRFPMKKYGKVRRIIQEEIQNHRKDEYSDVHCEFRISPLATVNELATTHCERYIKRYIDGQQTDTELRNVGFPWSTSGVNRSLSSVGGTLAASIAICERKREQQKIKQQGQNQQSITLGPCWSAHVAGGTHHAFHDRGEGFCVFSDIAVAANVILERYPDIVKRILILDLDVHQGNGNAVLFCDRDDVFTFSMHCSANYFSKKEHSDLDIELPPNCSDETYLSTLQHWLKRLDKEAGHFDLLYFQAGVDILDDDRLGRMSLSYDGVRRRNKIVFDFAKRKDLPLCITMGGGYPKKDWDPILEAHANVYIQAYKYLGDNHI